MRYLWEDLSDSELRVRLQRKMRGTPFTDQSLRRLVRDRDDPDAAAMIDHLLGNQ